MPLVTITTRPHLKRTQLLAAVADAVAEAIEVGPGDVIAMSLDASASIGSGGATPQGDWLIISIHGSDRGDDATTAARAAATRAAADWGRENLIDIGGVWSEWILPQATR